MDLFSVHFIMTCTCNQNCWTYERDKCISNGQDLNLSLNLGS